MFCSVEFELIEFWLACEIILVDVFIVESTRIDFEELIAGHLVVDHSRVRQFYVMYGHVFHSDFVLIIGCAKTVVEFFHLSSEMTAAEGAVDHL